MKTETLQRRLAGMYFLIQAIAIVGWWALLLAVPQTRSHFAIRGAPFAALGAFALGDLGIIALGSAIVGIRMGRGWTIYAAWTVTGALLYATCYVVVASVLGVSSPMGAVLMLPAAVASIAASAILSGHAHADPLSPRSSA